ncbi:hypothetical protein EMIHUDRAFT_449531 [Emiliania huxleyi CCMP1516]|uniref:Calcineurin-like phosphoesterase domain-containing protein n=2 Tax=Emiliania huxleyi TaxID=2903 RepID=A0A0D3K8P4_EMIH1|nr:hypothetical protein EMIHUDRAFT_449531 [Emiliania huxleyi CCMP1516]EOD32129.1 hypothetical protein EMIHUDRAFT_449531 [Emiliania huxleyi CCMP1516]|eukprot:XP_005784558.1 hypothetical protein EMIHUDRAFT_449531 [Emiliania huxleyi CCMP1516]
MIVEEEDLGTDFYAARCDEEVQENDVDECEVPSADEFTVAILGDLHVDPRKLDDYAEGRSHIVPVLEDAASRGVGAALVSLGDLGESKPCWEGSPELYAGTTACHDHAAEYLSSFGVPYEVVGGNHDLEGIDEFATDAENLEAFCRIHGKPAPQFVREIADKTVLVGLTSTIFRGAKYTSHEVTVDDEQLSWFEDFVASKPAEEGWKLFVFTRRLVTAAGVSRHAPPMGSGLRVLQENHVVNGCCWLNHSGGEKADPRTTRKFIELDSITFPTVPREEGPYPNRGSCVFVQAGVMRGGCSRDGRRQSRLLRGNKAGFEILTVNHANGGSVRLDATITYKDSGHEVYSPSAGDGCYVGDDDALSGECVGEEAAAGGLRLHEPCVYDGRLIEYDASTLAPLGLVVGADELDGRRVVVVGSGADECVTLPKKSSFDFDMQGAECASAEGEGEEQAVLLVDDESATVTVVQPNEDGSYWRKIVRNKMVAKATPCETRRSLREVG